MDKAALHRNISYIKSVLRLLGYVLLVVDIKMAVITLVFSEGLGILEEVFGS